MTSFSGALAFGRWVFGHSGFSLETPQVSSPHQLLLLLLLLIHMVVRRIEPCGGPKLHLS